MHPDKKVGLALGILLIGITGAFFFRNEVPGPDGLKPALATGDALDEHIRRSKSRTPYFPDPSSRDTAALDLAGVQDSLASNVMPKIPDVMGLSGEPLPEPIRAEYVDRVTPIPAPGADDHGVGAALAQAGTRRASGATHLAGSDGLSPSGPSSRLSQTPPPGTTPGLGASAVRTDGRDASSTDVVIHEVVSGDTLSGIAEKYLGSHRRYRELYEVNRGVLSGPDDVRVGMKLIIPQSFTGNELPPSSTPSVADHNDQSRVDSLHGENLDSTAAETSPPDSDRSASGAGADDAPRLPGADSLNGNKPKGAPTFIRPERNPLLPRRGVSAIGSRHPRSQSGFHQASPPDLPRVVGFDVRRETEVIAARPDETDGARSTRSE